MKVSLKAILWPFQTSLCQLAKDTIDVCLPNYLKDRSLAGLPESCSVTKVSKVLWVEHKRGIFKVCR